MGSCRDLFFRLEQHKDKIFPDNFTAKADDWILFFSIDGLTYNQARKIELHIKKMKSSTYIKNLKSYPEISNNLVENMLSLAAQIAIGVVDALVAFTSMMKIAASTIQNSVSIAFDAKE